MHEASFKLLERMRCTGAPENANKHCQDQRKILSMRYDADWLEGMRASCFQSRAFQSPHVDIESTNATCDMPRHCQSCWSHLHQRIQRRSRWYSWWCHAAGPVVEGDISGGAGGCGCWIALDRWATNGCDVLWLSCAFPLFWLHLHHLPSCEAAKRFSNSDHTDLPADLVFIDADHSEAASYMPPYASHAQGFSAGRRVVSRGCCILWCVLWALAYDFPGSSFQRHRCMAQAQWCVWVMCWEQKSFCAVIWRSQDVAGLLVHLDPLYESIWQLAWYYTRAFECKIGSVMKRAPEGTFAGSWTPNSFRAWLHSDAWEPSDDCEDWGLILHDLTRSAMFFSAAAFAILIASEESLPPITNPPNKHLR